MWLIGRLDSPEVRRVAFSLRLPDLPFEHRSISVLREMPAFAAVNLMKAYLVCDDGSALMDSTLILQFAERLTAPRRAARCPWSAERCSATCACRAWRWRPARRRCRGSRALAASCVNRSTFAPRAFVRDRSRR